MKVIILGNVRHDNVNLKKYQSYDLPEKDAQTLIKAKMATTEGIDEQTQVRSFMPQKNKIDPATGMRIPGAFEDDTKRAQEQGIGSVKAVEPQNTTQIQGSESQAEQTPPQQSQDVEKKGV